MGEMNRQLKLGIVLLFAILFTLVLSWTPQARATVRALGFVPQVLPDVPVKPAEWFTAAPERHRIAYPLRNGENGVADLYVPAGDGAHSAVMFFLGVHPAGQDDERVVNLANSLARTGIVVMIPWSERMAQGRVSDKEVDDLVHGFQYLRSLEMVDSDKVGMAGFSVGSSLMMVAAQDERIREYIKVVNWFGGYYDAKDLIASVVSKSRFYGEESRDWTPDKLSVGVVRTHLLESVQDVDERAELLHSMQNGSTLRENLSDDARVVYDILNAPDHESARRLMERLPPSSLDTIRRISPRSNMGNLSAKVLAMHDREDSLVPSEESRRLVDALQKRGEIHYTEFSFFNHLDPTRPVGRIEFVREASKLFLHIYKVMRELD